MTKQRGPQLPKSGRPRGTGRPQRDRPYGTGAASVPAHAADMVEQAQRLAGEGAHLLAEKRPGEAALLLARALELDPDNAAAAINLGGALILQGKHKLAIPILEQAARLEPDNPMIWSNLAAAYLGNLLLATPEQQNRAIAAYERTLALDARAPHVHYNLGLIYLKQQDVDQAAGHFLGALATDPDDRDARLWLDRIGRGEIGPRETAG